MKQDNIYFLFVGGSDGREERPLLPPAPRPGYLLQASPQKTQSPGPVVQEFPLPIQENWCGLKSSIPFCICTFQRVLLELLSNQKPRTPILSSNQ